MSQPFIGEIRMFGGSFAPAGWAFCSGQVQAISQNDALFSLLGTTYGGDGINTFNLPDLQGRVPIHMGTSRTGTTFIIGQRAGVETVTLTTNQMPIHNHALLASTDPAMLDGPQNNVLASNTNIKNWTPFPTTQPMNVNAITAVGGSQPHGNMMPFLAVSFIIALFGIFPSQN
jgi:microcystin-dependent protein